jgi:tRNA dimethylallyltransferase
MSLPDVIAIFGPTASGKSAIAEALASELATEVVSADSMQAYDGLPILTNQPLRSTRLVGVWPLDHEGSVAEFAKLAHAAIDDVVREHGTALLVGGTGLYVRAALAELDLPPRPEPGARVRWERAYDASPDDAYAKLVACDPDAARIVHRNDRRRVIRALELVELGSSLVSDEDRLWSSSTRLRTLVVGLDVPKDLLERRIVRRAREMFERGVVEEVEAALARGPISRTAERALGLRDVIRLPPDEAEASLVRHTTRYAAYQRKWMRRIPGIVMIDASRPCEEVVDEILHVARAR